MILCVSAAQGEPVPKAGANAPPLRFVGAEGIELKVIVNDAQGVAGMKASCRGASPRACRARIRGHNSNVNLVAGVGSRGARAHACVAVLCTGVGVE